MDKVTGRTHLNGTPTWATVTGMIYQECPDFLVIYGTHGGEVARDHLFDRDGIESVERNVAAATR